MKVRAKIWVGSFALFVVIGLSIIGILVWHVDPFFHYHKPYTNKYYYVLDNERSQNDGISKHFEYDALITGTSMTENFKVSELNEIFQVNAVKLPYSGGSYREINNNLASALEHNPKLKTIVRGLDMDMFFSEVDRMRTDLGEFPTYLYDKNILNDVKYLFNRDVIFERAYPMILDRGVWKGITSFDLYANWGNSYTYGVNSVLTETMPEGANREPVHITEAEKKIIRENISQNVTSLPMQYPDVTFYYFFPPYSAAWWHRLLVNGDIYRQIEAEQLIIEEILKCENIKLYSFNCCTDIVTDLNNYKDTLHYGPWINSLMLRWIKDECYILTKKNYIDYLKGELEFYTTFDYHTLLAQDDYENDFYAAALLNEEFRGVEPFVLTESVLMESDLNGSFTYTDPDNGSVVLACKGCIQRSPTDALPLSDYLMFHEYIGCRIEIENADKYQYLSFWGKKESDHGQPLVYIYDDQDGVAAEYSKAYPDLDNEWHQYMLDVSQLTGKITVIFNGGYPDWTGDPESVFLFKDITFY